MKKFLVMVLVILFAFALTSVTFAYPPAEMGAPKAEEKKTEPKKAIKQITGEVTAIDATAKAITVKGKKAEVIVTVDDKMLADVKVGDKIVVKYEVKDEKNIAKTIKIKAKASETKAEPAKPGEPAKSAEPAKKKKAIEGC